MRTSIYVDGFNLYYGALRKTDFKWLAIRKFAEDILGAEHYVDSIKYFAARVIPRESDPTQSQRQDSYWRALSVYARVEIIEGKFARRKMRLPRVGTETEKVQVWRPEEKGSDVNLAINMLNDAWRNEYDCAVLISDDSDFAGVLEIIKAQHPNKVLGLISPCNRIIEELRKRTDFQKRFANNQLQRNQLPIKIPNANIHKPPAW